MNISPLTLKSIRLAGSCLFVAGLALVLWVLPQFDSLPNYLRLLSFVPLAFGVPMAIVNHYFVGWHSLAPLQKGRAIAWLVAPFLIFAGALVWYVSDPAAKA